MNLPLEIKIKLNGEEKIVKSEDYVEAKAKDLIEFGFPSISVDEVKSQLGKILIKEKKLNIIGYFIQKDIVLEE